MNLISKMINSKDAITIYGGINMTYLDKAQKDGYINITGAEGKRKIEYVTSERHTENYEDPEEKVRACFFCGINISI